jgi:hypothetical protein
MATAGPLKGYVFGAFRQVRSRIATLRIDGSRNRCRPRQRRYIKSLGRCRSDQAGLARVVEATRIRASAGDAFECARGVQDQRFAPTGRSQRVFCERDSHPDQSGTPRPTDQDGGEPLHSDRFVGDRENEGNSRPGANLPMR